MVLVRKVWRAVVVITLHIVHNREVYIHPNHQIIKSVLVYQNDNESWGALSLRQCWVEQNPPSYWRKAICSRYITYFSDANNRINKYNDV